MEKNEKELLHNMLNNIFEWYIGADISLIRGLHLSCMWAKMCFYLAIRLKPPIFALEMRKISML